MTDSQDPSALPPAEDETIDGHTASELDAYLAAGRTPYNASIENSADCILYLTALTRLKSRSWAALTREAEDEPGRDELWISGLLDTIRNEVRAGRDIPIRHPEPQIRLTLTEAAVHGLIRASADSLDGLILGRTVLDGEISTPGAPVTVALTVAAQYGLSLAASAEALRRSVAEALAEHTELNVTAISVTIEDVYLPTEAQP